MAVADEVTSDLCLLRNTQAVPVSEIPVVPVTGFRDCVIRLVKQGARLVAYFGLPAEDHASAGPIRVFAVLANDYTGRLLCTSMSVDREYPSLTPDCPQAHRFECELAEQWGVVPVGHPWLKPLRYHHSYRPGVDAWQRDSDTPIEPCVTNYFHMDGAELHEVAVGPIHAGVIEPGSFRLQCHGEQVYHLEVALGYQHRGVERALIGGPNKRTLHYLETLSGDTSVGHTLAYCQAVEALTGCRVPARAQVLRGVGLELERLANHTGDLGGLATDIGFQPTSAFGGRLRGDFLNCTLLWCGNRFGRSAIVPGGIRFDLNPPEVEQIQQRVTAALTDLAGAVELLFDSPSVQARFEDTGIVTLDVCEALGLVGPIGRAAGAERDVRRDFPTGVFRFAHIPVAVAHTGDVFARACIRWLECQRSIAFVQEQLAMLPSGNLREPCGSLAADSFVVSMVEGWRGEICHVAVTDKEGRFARYKVVDPSFHNWTGIHLAMRDQQISDFPLCNKSFSLSYCGHDL